MKQKTVKKAISLILSICLLMQVFVMTGFAVPASDSGAVIQNLKTENLVNPIGIDVETPRFSWQMEDSTRGQCQTAYEILVAESAEQLANGDYVWTSGRVESDESQNIPYGGENLKASTRYFWQVRVWDKDGAQALSTEEAYFETGLMEENPLGDVQWLTKGKKPVELVNTVFTFEADVRVNVDAAGLLFGRQDESNYFFWQIRIENGRTYLRPHKCNNGNWEYPGNVDITDQFPPESVIGQTIHVKIAVDNGHILTYFNDIQIAEHNLPAFNIGGIGLRQSNNGGVQEDADFDNIKVTLGDGSLYFAEDFSDPSTVKFEGGAITEDGMYNVVGNVLLAKMGVSFRLDADIRLKNLAAGLLFGVQDENNFIMWQFNAEGDEVLVRPHGFVDGGWTYPAGSFSIADKFSKEEIVGQVIHVRLDVVGGVVSTYINDVLCGTSSLGDFEIGGIGFRQSGKEEADYDNIKLTLPDGTVSFEEDFSNPDDLEFEGGTITEDGMYSVVGQTILGKDLSDVENPAPMFRKEFSTSKEIESARLYATSAGTYEAYINGQKVGDAYLNPGRTKYSVRVMYQTFDVTDLLREGDNAIGVTVGHGWFNRAKHNFGGTLGFAGKLVIRYTDGTSDMIITDDTWFYYSDGPVRDDDMFNGEKYDATKEPDGWKEPGFEEKGWTAPVLKTADELNIGEVVAQEGPLVKNTITLPALSVTEPVPGVYVYDFGQNIAGICRVKVTGERGQTITMRHGEKLNGENQQNSDGPVGTVWVENLREAECTDTYTLKGDPNGEVFEPSLVYHGFQYMELTGVDEPIPVEDVQALVLSSELETTGSFESSNQYVNKLVQNTLWSQIDNFLSVPTDCPQRDERLGWCGDAQIFARTASYLMDVNSFMEKYMQDIRDEQSERGNFPNGAPGWSTPSACGGWSDAGVIIPWQMYQQYGNKQFILDNYDAMKKYIDMILSDVVDYIDVEGEYMNDMFGDWLAVEHTPFVITETAYAAYSTHLFAEMAKIVGNTEDAETYAAHFEKFREAWNREFVNPDGSTKCDPAKYGTGEWGNKTHPDTGEVNTQCSYILGLHFGLFEEEVRPLAAARLAKSIEDGDYHIKTGFLGVSLLNPVLTDNGYSEVAFKMMEQEEYPSWLYAVVNGANTIYEKWDGYQELEDGRYRYNGSLNHYSYGSVTEWLFRDVLGIEADVANPGYKHILLQPHTGGSFTYAKGSYNSIYGEIKSGWELTDNGLVYSATVPANTTATLTLPALDEGKQYLENGVPASESEGVTFTGVVDGEAVYELTSGSFSFTVGDAIPAITVEAPASAVKGEAFTVTATTPGDVANVALFNENGLKMGLREITSATNDDDTITWTFKVSIGTAGTGRALTLATIDSDGVYTLTDAGFVIDIVHPAAEVLSASIDETGVVNIPVTLKVVTNEAANKIVVTNENGLKMGLVSQNYQDTDEGRVWTVQMKIGTSGTRRFSVAAKNLSGVESEAVTTNDIAISPFAN